MKTLRSEAGLSLVELMIGLVIGLVTILVIAQVGAVFEGQKRTSTGGSDAQVNGNVALFEIEREIRMAGYGLATPGQFLCPLGINIYHDLGGGKSIVTDGGALAPVIIVSGGAGPDTILTVRSDAAFSAVPDSIVKNMPNPSSIITAAGPGGLQNGQFILVGATDGSKVCTLMQMTKDPQPTGGGWDLNHNPGASGPYNPSNPNKVFTVAPTYTIGDVVMNMGNFLYERFDVLCENLTVVNPINVAAPYTCANTTALVSQIVNMKAQYGIAPAGSQIINEWRNPVGIWAWDPVAGTPSAANINRIKAIRIAIVARSPQYEKTPVSPATLPLWTADPAGADPAPTMALTAGQQLYRYKIFETIVPVRNVIWAGV